MPKPKVGTVERIVFDKLVSAGGVGVTINDFTDYPEITEETLDRIIKHLISGIYEGDLDNQIKFDA